MSELLIALSILVVFICVIRFVILFFQYRKTPKHEWKKLQPAFFLWIGLAFLAMGVVDFAEEDGSLVGGIVKVLLGVFSIIDSRRRKHLLEKENASL